MNFFTSNPYRFNVGSPYYYGYGMNCGRSGGLWTPPRPKPDLYTAYVQQTIQLNAVLNAKAQSDIDAKEPEVSIWQVDNLAKAAGALSLEKSSGRAELPEASQASDEKSVEKRPEENPPTAASSLASSDRRQSWFKKMISRKSPEEKEAQRLAKLSARCGTLRHAILQEEHARWPTQDWRRLVAEYQDQVGMTRKIAALREACPIQYLHLLRAGYFEPIPVAWADQASNPLKFRIEGMEGWRGITPAWRGFEDTAEERLYWVLNHRDGVGAGAARLKPDIMSALHMARQRMAAAVEPPPEYFSAADTCHVQHTTTTAAHSYSRQVMPPPWRPWDAPETAADDTMILLDVSGSMDFEPMRPNYNEYLITGYSRSTQPKNKGKLSHPAQ